MLKSTLFLFFLYAFCSYSSADIYIGEDKKGVMHFTDNPEPGSVTQSLEGNTNQDGFISLIDARERLMEEMPKNFCNLILQRDVSLFVKYFSNFESCLSKMTEIHKVCFDLIIKKFPTVLKSRIPEVSSELIDCYKALGP